MAMRSKLSLRLNSLKVVGLILFLLGVILFSYISRRALQWHSHQYSTALAASPCPHCSCDCFSEPTFDFSLEVVNSSMADCGKDDPETKTELQKNIVVLLSEEIMLQKNVSDDILEHAKALIMGAKRTSLHYQKEAEKCNAGVETCEDSRERAEAALIEERKLTALWISRAHEYGWDEEDRSDIRWN